MPKKNNYYAYRLESGKAGICASWKECEAIVRGVKARYRGFETKEQAQLWLDTGAPYEKKIKPKLEKGIYFDAGTGRGAGVELKVTDEKGKNLLPKAGLTRYETHKPKGLKLSNNYGELLAAKMALELAMKKKIKKIFGDSRLVLEYWSRGYIKRDKLPKKTVDLAMEVKELRRKFEKGGGVMAHVSGDHNPADLGFHR
ncbi:MAG: viroplasmin family protein [Candidatus Harrisonbacteria bacterium]|nr:viroplasmin family protein [Candidatus Harrisonbacteria bacterium]